MSADVDIQSASERVAEISETLVRAEHAYYILEDPFLADAEYDSLLRELRELEAAHPELVSPNSPTQRVGGGIGSAFAPVVHQTPMLSLGNVFGRDELERWLQTTAGAAGNDTKFCVEPKIDGLAVTLRYEDGELVEGATRGNGVVGEEITANLRTIRTVPLRLTRSVPGRLDVRGEVYFPRDAFNKLNQAQLSAGARPYANPRNAASGSLRQKDPRLTAARGLAFFAYSVAEQSQTPATSQSELLSWLGGLGFYVSPDAVVCSGIDAVFDACDVWRTRRDTLNFETDGAVIKVDSFAMQRRLGARDREPRWAIALKFPAVQATTILKDITIQVSRRGQLAPAAVLEPVQIGGVTVSAASLFNEEDIARRDLRIGDRVIVERRGEVIPQIIAPVVSERTGNETPIVLPEVCPSCGTATVRYERQVGVFCPNTTGCPEQRVQRIIWFAARPAMDIEGLGAERVRQLIDAGLVNEPDDLYRLDVETLSNLERFAAQSATKLVEAIAASKAQPLPRLLVGLGIGDVGEATARDLSDHFGSMAELRQASMDDLLAISGIGPIVANAISAYLAEPANQALIDRLAEVGVTGGVQARRGEGPLKGETWVVTGTLDTMSREAAESRLRALGATVTGSVSKKTTFVLVGQEPGASKITKANSLSIPQVTETEFLNRISNQAD